MNSLRKLMSVLLLFYSIYGAAQTAKDKPVITNIDPPDWFVQLPDPMLLIHGLGLKGAHFSLQANRVSIVRSKASENGHWAFVWLKTEGAGAQSIRITATNASGAASFAYPLQPRQEAVDEHRGFTQKDVIYLIMTDRFSDGDSSNNEPATAPGGYDRSKVRGWHGGDFAGIDKHLDYLQSLGVTMLWTTPVDDNGAMPQSYHGYAATNLYAVDPHFGTLNDYQKLSTDLHARGMKLVIDLVPNHIGIKHPWIADPPTPDWFHGTVADHTHAGGDFHDLIDPHTTPASTRPLTEGWFTDGMPDMNQENPLVSQYLIQNALWWVETARVDAIRLDTFPYVGRAFWHDFHAALHKAFPELRTVGEVFNPDPVVTSFFAGEREHFGVDTGLDSPFDFPVYFALRDVLTHEKPMTELASILKQDSLYPHPDRLIHFFGNHDTTRFLTEAKGSMPRLKEAIGLIATLRGTPEIYSGDEIAMAGGEDPDNRRDFPGGFPPGGLHDGPSAFDATTRTEDQQAAFSWSSALFALRKNREVLQGAPQQDLFADETALAFVRTGSVKGCVAESVADQYHDAILAVVNKNLKARELVFPTTDTALAGCNQFQPLAPASDGSAFVEGGSLHIKIPADSFVLFSVH